MRRQTLSVLVDDLSNVYWIMFGVVLFLGGLQLSGWYMLLGVPGLVLAAMIYIDLIQRVKDSSTKVGSLKDGGSDANLD